MKLFSKFRSKSTNYSFDKKLLSRQLVSLADKIIYQLIHGDFINNLKKQASFTPEKIKYFELISKNILVRIEYLKAQAIEISTITV
jgi:serine/threonine-protein kinase HipA